MKGIGSMGEMGEIYHVPVLLKETIDFLNVKKGGRYIDATVGGGGHTEAILEAGGIVLGIDCDPEALEFTRKRLSQACPAPRQSFAGPLGAFKWTLSKGNFKDIAKIAGEMNINKVEGILFDLGVSSHQLETHKRGFSLNAKADLDMRMSPELTVTAADLVNGLNEGELDELFTKLGEEHHSRRIAAAICRARRITTIEACDQLAEIVLKSVPPRGKPACRRGRFNRIHPATRIFQALRIAVNDELNSLKEALPQSVELLNKKGRLVVISFHSLEDGIVKNFMRQEEKEGYFKILTERPITPLPEEVAENPRARSAKLRAAEKIY